MNSYKLGDIVRVRDDLVVGEWYGNYENDESETFESGMESFKGKVVKIEKLIFNGGYEISDYAGHYSDYRWVDKMFYDEPIKVGDRVKICGFDFSGDYNFTRNERMLIATTDLRKTLGMEGIVRNIVDDLIKVELNDGKTFYYEKVWLKKIDIPKVVSAETPKEDNKSKYKVGDKVIIVNDDSVHYDETGTVEEADCKNGYTKYLIRFYSGKELYYNEDELEEAPTCKIVDIEPLTPPSELTSAGHVIALSTEPKTVDVGYYLEYCGEQHLEDVIHGFNAENNTICFTTSDRLNQYLIPKSAIKWVIPHIEK